MLSTSAVITITGTLAGAMRWAGPGRQLGARDRLPMPQPLGDQLHALPIVASVQDAHVLWIGAPVNAGRPRVHSRVRVRTSREVPGRAIGGLQPDLPGPVQLRRVRVAAAVRPSSSRRCPKASFLSFTASLQYLADRVPSSCHARPVSSSAPSRSREIRRRLTAEGSRCGCAPSGRTATTGPRCGRRGPRSRSPCEASGMTTFISAAVGRFVVAYAREAEEIGRKLRAARVQDEGSAHSEDCRRKGRLRRRHCLAEMPDRAVGSGCAAGCWSSSRPERTRTPRSRLHASSSSEAFQCGGPGIEGRRPGFDVRDVFETARQRLQQLLLLSRRAQEDARLVHPFLPTDGVSMVRGRRGRVKNGTRRHPSPAAWAAIVCPGGQTARPANPVGAPETAYRHWYGRMSAHG